MRSDRLHTVLSSLLAVATSLALLAPVTPLAGQQADVDAEVARQQKIAERFQSILEKNPRRGTALDKVYGFHVENGTLDEWMGSYQKRVEAKADDGLAWMMLGLVQSHRGQDAEAVAAFAKASEFRSDDPLAPFYLGQALVLVGRPEEAVTAFETALKRNPSRTDLLDIFQSLGRVHQRAQRTEEALSVWTRLEKLFPNDSRVQEEIVATLVEEGQFAQALPRYQTLIKGTRDDYRRSVYRMEQAELKVKLNRSSEAIADLEQLLASLNPTSWLHREVRRKIEDVFLRTDDQDGLAKYYEGWVKKNPEDVDAMARLARILARQARVPEAQTWLDKALKLAPSRKELRLAFIAQLVDDQRFSDAIRQYEILDKADPNNPDHLRELGKLILRDTSRPKDERLKEAEQVWRRLVAARPKDPLVATQVADMLRHAQMNDAALELYKKAVELAPAEPQYREYLGEFYHKLDRRDEALATWRPIAEGKLRTGPNTARLAEVLATFGYTKEAADEITAACELDPKDYSLHLKAADFLAKAERYDDALTKLTRADELAQNVEEKESVLASQLKIYQLEGTLAKWTADLEAAIAGGAKSAANYYLLARYQEASNRYTDAMKSIDASLQDEPNSIPSLATAARIYEQAGDLGSAAALNRRLAAADRRGRSDYLKRVSQLEAQLGRTDEALAAGKELLASAPGHSENMEFYADLCFRLGKIDEGLDTLRRAVRMNPGEANLLMRLGSSLAEQFRSAEAIEIYWQAYDKADSIDDKLGVVQKLADLHLETNHLDRLLDRLERQRAEADQKREATICLAQVYHAAGDYGMARQELESLLSENTRDTQLLQQLSKLSEAEADLASAVKYQEQLAQVAPGAETEYRLATLLARNGQAQESADIIVRLAMREEDVEKLLRNIDSLLSSEQHETAMLIVESRLRDDPTNWELLYRQGVALSANPEAAKSAFEAILRLDHSDNEPGTIEKNRRAKAARQAANSQRVSSRQFDSPLNASFEVRAAVGLQLPEYYGISRSTLWAPATYGHARMAAIGWLYKLAGDNDAQSEKVREYKQAAAEADATPRVLWDWQYLASLAGAYDNIESSSERLATLRRLAELGDPLGEYLYLTTLANRGQRSSQGNTEPPPLSQEEMNLALRCYENLRNRTGADGREWVISVTNTVLTELRRCGRNEEEQRIYDEVLASTNNANQLVQAISLTVSREDVPRTLDLFQRWSKLTLNESRRPTGSYSVPMYYQFGQLQGKLGAAKKHEELLAIYDHYFDHYRALVLKAQAKSKRRSTTSSMSSPYRYFSYWYGKNQQSVRISYPRDNHYYDAAALQMLRGAFEVFKRNDLMSDFERHLANRVATAEGPAKAFEQLAVAYVCHWNEEPAGALESLREASRLIPQDTQLLLEVAQYHYQTQEYDEALDLIDSFPPTDQDTLRDRENLALDVAVRLGDRERARQAAERLFGLRLAPEMQVQLADQMRRLGMNEHAEAVLARAQRQAGNRLSALVALMNSHQSQGRSDVAAQIAHQILRRSRTPTPSGQPRYSTSDGDSQGRSAALQVLSSAGKLKEMIAAAEEQLERTPQATQLYSTLAEYYEAAGDRTKALEWHEKVVELRPDDASLRMRLAARQLAAGKADKACEQYLIALRKEPRLMGNNFYEIIRTFKQAEKQAELSALLGEIDLKSFSQYYYVMDFVRELMSDETQRPAAMALFKKAWEAYPNQRLHLLGSFYDESVWKLPEMYAYGVEALIPTAEVVQQNPWHGPTQVITYSGDGNITTVVKSVITIAENSNRLPDLRDKVAASVKENPNWKSGMLILAILDAKTGKIDEAQAAIEKVLESEAEMPGTVGHAVGLEIESISQLRPLVLRLYERGHKSTTETIGTISQFQYGPGPRLVRLYSEAGRRDEARRLLVEAEKQRVGDMYDPLYAFSQQIETHRSIAGFYRDLDFKVDALRLYRQVVIRSATADPAARQYGSLSYYQAQAEQELASLVESLQKSKSVEVVDQLLTPRATADEEATLDLMVAARPGVGGIPEIDSQLISLLDPKTLEPELKELARRRVAELCREHPENLNVQVLDVVLRVNDGESDGVAEAVRRLQSLAEKRRLAPLSGRRANSREREEAEQLIPLWFAAQACLAKAEWRPAGEAFAEQVVQAARRVTDQKYVAAILFAQSKAAYEANQPKVAEGRLRELLEIVAARPTVKPKPMADVDAPPPVVRTPRQSDTMQIPARMASRPANKSLAPPLTLSQFNLAMAVANLTARYRSTQVAQLAVLRAFAGGLPVPDAEPTLSSQSQIRMVVGNPEELPPGANVAINQAVATSLTSLSRVWSEQALPPEMMYDALCSVVLPSNQSQTVVLVPTGRGRNAQATLAPLLARWAVAAGKAENLRMLLTFGRAGTSELEVRSLLVHLALHSADPAVAAENLKALSTGRGLKPKPYEVPILLEVASAAFPRRELRAVTVPLLENLYQALQSQQSVDFNSVNVDPGSAGDMLIQHYRGEKNFKEIRRIRDEFFAARHALYARYSGGSELYQQRQDAMRAASVVAPAGDLQLTLDSLARFADLPSGNPNYAQPSQSLVLWHLTWQVRRLPAAERYQVLRDWTLPAEDRRSIRFVVATLMGPQIPASFVPEADRPLLPGVGPVSNFTLLIEAAKEAGKLDELSPLVDQCVADKLNFADTLASLIAIASEGDRASAAMQQLVSDIRDRKANASVNNANQANDATHWKDLLILGAGLDSAASSEALSAAPLVLQSLRGNRQYPKSAHASRLIALHSLAGLPPEEKSQLTTPGLRLWTPGTPPQFTTDENPPAWWAAHDKFVTHLTGFDEDSLFFNYPLTGEFEFSFEVHSYDGSQGEVAYGGLVSHPQFWGGNARIYPVSRQETVARASTVEARDWWNQYSVKVSPESIRFYSNGHLVYEDVDPSPTSPWLHLVSLDHRRTVFRNLRLTGKPTIPAEVRLTHGDRLEGWIGGTMPKRLTLREPTSKSNDDRVLRVTVDSGPLELRHDWQSIDGVVHGRQNLQAGPHTPGRLQYHRPLLDGEEITYEFFYEPGSVEVHPSIGNLTFHLRPEGVGVRWFVPRGTTAINPLGLSTDNVRDEPEHRRGPDKLPLVASDWNRIQLALAGDVVTLRLNDVVVFERPLEPIIDRRFGLFHFTDQTSAQVRNVVLRGNWPKELSDDDRENLLALAKTDESPALAQARHALVREEEQVDEVVAVVAHAASLPVEERYEFLREWVLPSPRHPTFRLQAEFRPAGIRLSGEADSASSGSTEANADELLSPAIKLVRSAAQLKRLDELASAIEAAQQKHPEQPRDVLALQLLVEVARENDPAATQLLETIHEHLKKLDPVTPSWQRFPELTAVFAALERPALRKTVMPIAALLVENQHSNYMGIPWERRVRWLRAKTQWLDDPKVAHLPRQGQQPTALKQWTAVDYPTAASRGLGVPTGAWRVEKGKAAFFTGHGGDAIYFQSPLTGNFELHCRRTTHGWKEIRPRYAGLAIDVVHTGKSIKRVPLARGESTMPLEAELPNWGPQIDCRLVVKDGYITVYMNDKQVHTERLAEGADPWLSIETASPHFNGWVEKVQIVGQPTIPDSLELSASPDLLGWRADYYGDTVMDDTSLWTKEKDEIVGRLHEYAPNSKRESVLHYHRPLLEDGVLEYEFYCEPGKTDVAPALDRTAYQFAPDGVYFHTLTDGAYDRLGLDPANRQRLEGATPAPLKENDWNQVQLKLAGDQLQLSLNGQMVAEVKLSPDAARRFGFFRFADETAARIRKVVHRGEWPKTLPPVASQELASPANGPLETANGRN